MPAVVAGRDAELAALRDFVAGISDGASALVLEGEAGMGKTTLWWAGVAAAGETGIRVLSTLAAESETALSFTGVGDLLDPVLDEALCPLPAAQRRALSRALILDDDEGPARDPHAVGVALLNALRALADVRPLLIAVDDVQWLDAASAGALAYAARRLRDVPVGILLSRRSGLESTLLDEVRRALPSERFREVDVGPLGTAPLHHVVQEHLGVTLPRPLLAEVHQAAGGNPFYALEIVRMLRRSNVSIEAGHPIPVPDSLHDLVHGRLLALPPESRDFLLAAAAHAHPTLSITESASEVRCADGLTPALEARIVEVDRERIRFMHPLLAAGAYEIADPLRRRAVHARLAEVLEDPEARAWQLAASVDRPDEDVAAALEDAARIARARGAPRPAALLLDRAAALTPERDDDDARRRRVEAAYAHHAAGDTERARALLDSALERARPGSERAGLLVALARVRSYDDDIRGASELYRQALDESEDGSLVKAYAQEGLGGTLFRLRERLAEAVDVSGAAAVTARKRDASQLVAEAASTKAVCEAALGRPEARKTAEAALALADYCRERPVLRQPRFAVSVVRFWHGDLAGARESFTQMAEDGRELGDESSMPYVHVMLGQIECASGRFEEALREAEEGRLIAELAGQRTLLGYALAVRAVAQAHLGQDAAARESAERALELARQTSGVPAWIFATWAAGHLELVRGDPVAATATLRPLVDHHLREEIREPGALPFMPDAVEALLASGELDGAAALIDGYAEAAERLDRGRAIAV
ncbi:MAG: AAA family ATPase, partial [Gaiellaceae bacterium]